MFRILAALVISILILMAYNADAQNGEGTVGRYAMSEVEGGFLRLDTTDGRVSFCHQDHSDWVCELIPDDRTAYEAEIGRLMEENRKLKDELAAAKQGRKGLQLPGREDVDRVMTYLDQMMRRFFDMVKSFGEKKEERTGSTPAPLPPSVPQHGRSPI